MQKAFFAVLLMTTLLLCSCSELKVGPDVHQRIYEKYSTMQSYHAVVKVSTISGEKTNVYTMSQYYKFPDKMRSEGIEPNSIAGFYTVTNGSDTAVYSNAEKQPVRVSGEGADYTDYAFLNNFFSRFYDRENAITTGAKTEEGQLIDLTVEDLGDNPYRQKMVLQMDKDTIQPVRLSVYGQDDKEYFRVEYEQFAINEVVEDALFAIEENANNAPNIENTDNDMVAENTEKTNP